MTSQRALSKNSQARDFFATLSGSARYAILYRIQDAKKPDTRARRIAQLVAMLAEGRKPSMLGRRPRRPRLRRGSRRGDACVARVLGARKTR